MIGWYCIATFPYYDNQNNRNAFKRRPMLVIGQADTSDFVTLPISKVSYRENIDIEYDIAIQIADYPRMQSRSDSYVRTHKQTITHRADITRSVVNVKEEYSDLWLEILSKVEDFQRKLTNTGLE
ncbi:hypothetical protein [Anaeroglobus geminatus]|jgi:hypothetical protein|uniref:PemK-like protein n=1 Tax=Anaeroglobus geminatus F0357 TaxID=861450 RepID=G9YFA4_9FIRM|nr:hypothetical protein [Anaeroglobus geminatus]EHM43272.1 hypothetical protein HMPREF0080_00315 [Anaeroglobus geminatus F0357]